MSFYLLNSPERLFNEFSKLQQDLRCILSPNRRPSNIRSVNSSVFPPINVSHNANSIKIEAFIPGVDSEKIHVEFHRGILTIQGERILTRPENQQKIYAQERFRGQFRRSVSLPDDIDSNQIKANYTNGVLTLFIARKAEEQAKRIDIR